MPVSWSVENVVEHFEEGQEVVGEEEGVGNLPPLGRVPAVLPSSELPPRAEVVPGYYYCPNHSAGSLTHGLSPTLTFCPCGWGFRSPNKCR